MQYILYPETNSGTNSFQWMIKKQHKSIKHKSQAHSIAMVYHIRSVDVTNPAGPMEEDEGHREHLLMKMNFLKLEHKRAETAKCLFGWRAWGKEGAERKRLHGR